MSLETYHRKRNFAATSEPKGRTAASAGNSYVIQKHDATRLHYDLRLEMDGVMKSWAVTRGPSLVPGEKRLAVEVEDHPLDYRDFEGTIPQGEYGGGTVIVWDRGSWTPLGDAHKGYAKGDLDFELHGEKLHGRWHLVRMHRKPADKRNNWLLIKAADDDARDEHAPDILLERPESVKTGRQIADVAGEAPGWSSKTGRITPKRPRKAKPPAPGPAIKGAKAAPMPDFVPPMLATLVTATPQGDRWLHEIKFDGYRLQARIANGEVKLFTRSGLDWTARFGANVTAALAALPVQSAIIDGELVVENASGASDFSQLQDDLSTGRADRFVFYAFDLLYLDGQDLCAAPLIARKQRLEAITGAGSGIIRYSGHFDESGEMVLRHACRLSLEGVVSKLRDSPYRMGRGKAWVKSKCSARQEFVVGGYVPSSSAPRAIGSLVLGVFEPSGLRHVGRVGTGYTAAAAASLFRRLDAMRVSTSPFHPPLTAPEARQVVYVRPELAAEVEFRAWTGDGHLRHASFRGLREDKPAHEIVREQAATQNAPEPERYRVALTHPDRLYWPNDGVTKEGLANYYTEVWRHLAPFIVGRALALVRCPNGITGEKFFQKHVWKGMERHIIPVKDPAHPAEDALITINDLDGLIGLVQGGALEIHPWGATAADWDHPDLITMDLDPAEDVPWTEVIAGAQEIRRRLQQAGLAAFVKTSGGKGLHVVAPLKPQADWTQVKQFTKSMADAMASDSPDRFVATITKSRRRGKILIDYLRNQRGATAVAPYSTRARPGAAVSMPLDWGELSPAIGPAYFTLNNTPARLAALTADPWADFRAAAAPLKINRR